MQVVSLFRLQPSFDAVSVILQVVFLFRLQLSLGRSIRDPASHFSLEKSVNPLKYALLFYNYNTIERIIQAVERIRNTA
jgi:hypothetical protein